MNMPPRLARDLLAACALGVLATVALPPAAAAQDASAIAFSIAAQPLDTALIEFARVADVQVLFAPQLVHGKQARPVAGLLSPEAALKRLVTGAGLTVVATGPRTFTLAAAGGPSNPDQGGAVDELVVTGVRASLISGIDQKREATAVVDAIAAKDIGDFPDLNLSEALQRITGVTVMRSANGEGRQVSVRGAPAAFTQVTLNGFPAANGNSGRDFDFDVFASELFQNVRLYKTQSADQVEGGLAATVDLRTPRPMDFSEAQLVMSGSGQYAELGHNEVQPRAAVLASRRFLDGRLGLLGSAAYSEVTARAEISQGFNWRRLRGVNFNPAASAGVTVNGVRITDRAGLEALADNVLVGQIPRIGPEDITRTRTGYTGAVQFDVTDDLRLSLDVLHATLKERTDRVTIDAQMSSNPSTLSEITLEDGFIVRKARFESISNRSERYVERVDSEFTHATFDADWRLNDAWRISGRAGWSKAQEDRETYNLIYAIKGPTFIDMTDPSYPRFGPIGVSHLDVNAYVGDQARDTRNIVDDKVVSGRLDLEWTRAGLLDTVKAGVEARRQQRTQLQSTLVKSFAGIPFRDIATYSVPKDFLEGAPDGTPTRFPSVDREKALALMFPEGTVLAPSPSGIFDITEKVAAGYLQTQWKAVLFGFPTTVDAGVRVVRTEQISEGFALVGASPQPTRVVRSYTDTLPSAIARIDLRDDLVLRLSGNKAIARPNLSDLAPGGTVAGNNFTATLGNPRLDPFRTTQFDASLEWYFAKGGLLQVAAFHKDISSFITRVTQSEVLNGTGLVNNQGVSIDGSTFLVSRPVNAAGGKLTGIEVGYQQVFAFLPKPLDGFGIVANATFADSSSMVDLGRGPRKASLQGATEVSYNLIGYYERERFSARVAYSYRGDQVTSYVDWYTAANLFAVQTDAARKQVDVSLRYDVSDSVSVTIDGLNILSEDFYSYTVEPSMNRLRNEQGSIWMLGVRAKF